MEGLLKKPRNSPDPGQRRPGTMGAQLGEERPSAWWPLYAGPVLVAVACGASVLLASRAAEPCTRPPMPAVRTLEGRPGFSAVTGLVVGVDGEADAMGVVVPSAGVRLDSLARNISTMAGRPGKAHKGLPRLRVVDRSGPAACMAPVGTVRRLPGLTLVAHDSVMRVEHYFHFMEHMLGLWAMRQASWPREVPARLVFEGGRTQDVHLRNSSGKGRFIRTCLAALFGGATEIVMPSRWLRAKRRAPLVMDRALVSSRSAAHTNVEVSHLNKMLAAHAASVRAAAASFREQLLRGLGVEPARKPRGRRGDPLRVGVIDRGANTSRRLSREFQTRLLRRLDRDPRFQAHVVRFQDFGYDDVAGQMRAATNVDVMIGCHGNGLTHALLMQPPAVLVELFPAEINWADYQLQAELGGHRHVAWSDRDGLLPQSARVVGCAAQYQTRADYRKKTDEQIFRGRGGAKTMETLLRLAYALYHARDDAWRDLVAPEGVCRPDPTQRPGR